jgi:hypothetical protein
MKNYSIITSLSRPKYQHNIITISSSSFISTNLDNLINLNNVKYKGSIYYNICIIDPNGSSNDTPEIFKFDNYRIIKYSLKAFF